MKTIRNSSNTQINSLTTESNISKTNQVFIDEYLFAKTDIGQYELIIILRPKNINRITQSQNSLLPIGQNYSNELFSIIKHYLGQSDFVQKILILKKGDVFYIWTVISDYTSEECRKIIYKNELNLMNFLSKAKFHFDFYLIESEEVDEIISAGALVIYKR